LFVADLKFQTEGFPPAESGAPALNLTDVDFSSFPGESAGGGFHPGHYCAGSKKKPGSFHGE